MKLEISNKHGDKSLEEPISRFIQWFVEKHITEVEELNIVVIVNKFVRGKSEDFGSAECKDRHSVWKTQFEVELFLPKSWKMFDLLKLLAHEMTHVKQFANDELLMIDLEQGLVRWLGRCYNTRTMSYYDLPWEIDAFGREKGIVLSYVQEHDMLNLVCRKFYF